MKEANLNMNFVPTAERVAIELLKKSEEIEGFDTGVTSKNPSLQGVIFKIGENVSEDYLGKVVMTERANAIRFVHQGKKVAIVNIRHIIALFDREE